MTGTGLHHQNTIETDSDLGAFDVPDGTPTPAAPLGAKLSQEDLDAFRESVVEEAAQTPQKKEFILHPSVKIKMMERLDKFRQDLREQLSEKYHEHVDTLRDEIEAKYKPLLEDPENNSKEEFQKWFEGRLVETRALFKAAFSVWHDVVRPALVGLFGVLIGIITSPALPFSKGTREFVGSFFKKPPRAEETEEAAFVSHVQKAREDLPEAASPSIVG